MAAEFVIDDLLIAGLDDWQHAADVAWEVQRAGVARSEIGPATASAIRSMLEKRLIEVGDMDATGFVAWDVTIDEAVARIEREWVSLDRDPAPGDICWLSNTTAGDRRARKALRRRGVAE